MARTRNIKPSFFKNEHLAECDPLTRLLFVGLWTLADSDGRLECRPLRIKAELFPYDNCDIVAMLEQLRERGFIRAYAAGDARFIDIPAFCSHQRCHPSEASNGFPSFEDGRAVNFHGEQLFFTAGLVEVEKVTFSAAKPEAVKNNCEQGKITASCALPSLSSFPSSNPSILKSSNPLARSETRPPRSRSKPSDSISWSSSGGWEGITDDDRAAWRTAYPACDIAGELARMGEWLRSNPAKAKKSRWRAFVTAWMTRSQDKGGGQASNRPGDRPPTTGVSSRRWRDDAQANMTDAQYAAWGRTQRPTGMARTLSNAISLRERNSAAQTTNARPGANAEPGGDDDEAGIEYEPDPVRDGWIGSDGRP